MLTSRRRLSVAAFSAMILASTGSSLAAQETNSANTVGPPQLKDFQLPGRRTTPPATQPQPVPQTAPQTAPPAAGQPARRTTGTATPSRPAPAPATRSPAPLRPAEATPQPAGAPPAAVPSPTTQPPVIGNFPVAPATAPPAAAPAPAPAQASSGSTWLWLGGAVLLALLGFLGFRRFSEARAEAARGARREERAAARAAAAASARAPGPVDLGPRARLELGFIPDRAVATDSETSVHYDLLLRNVGTEPARNIRIDARMFNASAQAAIGAFLKGPIHEQSGSPLVTIEAGAELKLASSIAMPKDEVKGIVIKGLSIFVPIVAINVAYDWGESGAGRTSLSWLVGREPETPSDKMGAFRLDLGPRIYRSVGQRPTELANVA